MRMLAVVVMYVIAQPARGWNEPPIQPAHETDAPPASEIPDVAEPGATEHVADEVALARQAAADLEHVGRFAQARAAFTAVAAMPACDAACQDDVAADVARVQERMRGKVASEPPSQHRAELDATWRPAPAVVAHQPVPTKTQRPREPLVRKWYFWVSVVALAASLATLTAVSVKAARDDDGDVLDGRAAPGLHF